MTTKPTYTPALRFPDFLNDGEWEVKRLGEVCRLTNGMAFKPSDWIETGIPIVRIQNLNDENAPFNYCAPEIIDDRCMIDTGTLLFSWSGTPGTSFGAFIWNRGKAVLNQHIFIVKPVEIDKVFLKMAIDANMTSIIEKSHGGAGLRHITKSDFEDIRISVPKDIAEQRRIAASLSALDEMLAATNGKLEQMKTYKKGLMQKLFPAKGKKLPELRFKEFEKDGEWVVKKLGEVGYTYTGLSGKDKNDFGHGDAEYITYLNVFSNPIIKQEMNLPIEIDNKQHSVQYGDVFFTTSSETPDEVGMSSVWLENKDNVYLNSFCFGYRLTEEFDYRYLSYYFRSDSFRKRMVVLAQGISRYNISKIKAMELPIQYPTIPEQHKIASCLSTMDDQINAYTEKVGLLGQYKKGLMQQMFPQNQMN